MAERRMFAKTIIDSDAFLDMPTSARLLYYDLSMRADDDGFINSPKKIIRMTGASDDDLKVLIVKKFVIPFENGVVVIKHWLIHNYIRKDTYSETPYKEEKAKLIVDENKSYKLIDNICQLSVNEPSTSEQRENFEKDSENIENIESQLSVNEPSTQDRIGKDRLDKDRIDKDSIVLPLSEEKSSPSSTKANEIQENSLKDEELSAKETSAKASKHKYGEYKNVLLKDEELQKLKETYDNWEELITYLDEYIEMKGYKAKSHYLCIKKWVINAVEREKGGNQNGNNQRYNNKTIQSNSQENGGFKDRSEIFMGKW